MRPPIAVTLADPRRSRDPAGARRKNDLYLDAVRRGGGEPLAIDETASDGMRADVLARMRGLLLTGGADIDPALYRALPDGSEEPHRGRDALELAAWRAADARALPVLGICRGFQAINVFLGGALVQHLDGHQVSGYGDGLRHPLRIVGATRLARILGHSEGTTLPVNSFHHQAVTVDLLAPGVAAAGFSPYDDGELVEALESADGRWIVGVQSHPERTDSTPPEFERLFEAFVVAAADVAAGD